jgi:hypothetical protein
MIFHFKNKGERKNSLINDHDAYLLEEAEIIN